MEQQNCKGKSVLQHASVSTWCSTVLSYAAQGLEKRQYTVINYTTGAVQVKVHTFIKCVL